VTLGSAGALAGDSDSAATFDGSDDDVTAPDDAGLRLNGSFTIEFWARQLSLANGSPGILDRGPDWNRNGYSIWADSGGGLWFERNGQLVGAGSGSLTPAFRYFVVTYDGSTVRWYVDGMLASTQAATFPTSAGGFAFQLGKADFYGNNELDEVALYDAALSAARIAAHYTAGT
jgi:hypothetical protein